MKVLVIGGTGNISRWFVPHLIECGYEVTLYNRGNHDMSFQGQVKMITGDRTDYVIFEKQMLGMDFFDCVIDMVGFEPDDAESAVRAFKGRIGQYIFCSTVDVFNKQPQSYPITEAGFRSASQTFPYAFKKLAMERIFQRAQHEDFPVTIIRPAATYSEGWSPLVTCFGGETYHLDRLAKGKPMILHGDGSAIWVASHSEDVGRAFLNAVGNKKTIGNAYNVTGDELLTWRTMHCIVAQELGAPAPLFVCIPTTILAKLAPEASEWCQENFQFNNIFDNGAAKRDLNFRYTISYRDGARRCIQYLRENGAIESFLKHPICDQVIDKWNLMVGN